MGTSSIEWTGYTWNPFTGCDRVSPGCDNCYALTLAKRLKAMEAQRITAGVLDPAAAKYQADGDPRTSGPGFGVTVHPDVLLEPLRWRAPRLVFVNSMSDIGHARVPRWALVQMFAVMALASAHTFQVLTKRPRRLRTILTDPAFVEAVAAEATRLRPGTARPPQWPAPNVWIGTSIESDAYSGRADDLRALPAAIKFLSCEPLLGPLPSLDLTGMGWVIAGGESGAKARPMVPDWVRSVRDLCRAANVAFFFKQWGAWAPTKALGLVLSTSNTREVLVGKPLDDLGHRQIMRRVGKRAAGRTLDGRTWDNFPDHTPTSRVLPAPTSVEVRS